MVSIKENKKMKKILLSLAALMIAATSYAGDNLVINLSNVPGYQAKKTDKKTDDAFSAQSFAGAPVLNNNGQLVGFEAAVLFDRKNENVAILRPLASYNFLGLKVTSVFGASVDSHGNNLYAGGGVLVPLGAVVPGLDVKVGGIMKGSNLSSAGRFDTEVVPAAQVKVDVPVLYGETKKLFNRIWLKFSPVGGKV
jgi:hypothetical protein